MWWGSLQERLALKFEELPFGRFVDDHTLALNQTRLIRTLKDHSRLPGSPDRTLFELIDRLHDEAHDPWHVCCGHDLVAILALSLLRALGTNNHTQVRADNIERSLRLSYEAAYFQTTKLYGAIQAWEQDNPPFKILAP